MPTSTQKNNGSIFSRKSSLFTSQRTRKDNTHPTPLHITSPIISSNSDNSNSVQSSIPSSRSTSPPLIPTRTSSKSSRDRYRQSHSISNVDLASLRRSVSLRSVSSPQIHNRVPSAATVALSLSYENVPLAPLPTKPLLHIPSFTKRQKSADAINTLNSETSSPLEPSRYNAGMSAVQYRSAQPGRPPATSHSTLSSTSYSQTSNGIGPTAPIGSMPVAGSQSPQMVFQHIMDTASKRISTLDYLRKAYVSPEACPRSMNMLKLMGK